MIVYANGKAIATDVEGVTQPVGIAGVEQDELKVSDDNQESLLSKILKELKISNIHLSSLTDNHITNTDVEV